MFRARAFESQKILAPMFHKRFTGTGQPVNLAAQDALLGGRNASDVDDRVQTVGGMMIG